MKFKHIENALKEGYKLHAFRSGGGLRVLRLECDNKPLLYGESADLKNALRILNDDAKAGGRKYSNVYGKIEDHYLTGSYASDADELDSWICSGKPFDVFFNKDTNQFVVDMSSKEDIKTPDVIAQRVFKKFETVYWALPGRDYIYKSSPSLFRSGVGMTTETIPPRSGAQWNDDMIDVNRIAFANDFKTVLENATECTKIKTEFTWYETFNKNEHE